MFSSERFYILCKSRVRAIRERDQAKKKEDKEFYDKVVKNFDRAIDYIIKSTSSIC